MYTKAEILTALHESRAQLFRDLEVIKSLTTHYTSCYINEADSQAIMVQRLHHQTVSTASAISVLEAGVANLHELEGKVAEIKEMLLQMTVEVMEIEALIREIESEQVEEAENEEAESEDDDAESVGDWGMGAGDAVDEEVQGLSVEGTESESGGRM